MEIEVVRKWFTEKSTSGQLFINGEYFCETLEDVARVEGVKIQGKTCIPVGRYKVTINRSPRFGRDMILLYTNDKDYSCDLGGIRFTGIRIHGGNDHTNTEGCILVAKNRISEDWIQGTMESKLLSIVQDAIDRGEKVTLSTVNLPLK